MTIKIASFFSGCGGLDLGFKQAGYDIVFANDMWKGCHETYEKNHHMTMCKKDITQIKANEIPDVDGFIGGPPCQSWSTMGSKKGINDPRGQLVYNYINLLNLKKPKFFLMENVKGMLNQKNRPIFNNFLRLFERAGYNITWKLICCSDYHIPQDRERIIIIGIRRDLNIKFKFPKGSNDKVTIWDAIGNLPKPSIYWGGGCTDHAVNLKIPNHEYKPTKFNKSFFTKNRIRKFNQCERTLTATIGEWHPCHPSSKPMIKIKNKLYKFDPTGAPPRMYSVREYARLQSFPDNFVFYYKSIYDGYKMIGNAVPPRMAYVIAKALLKQIFLK